MPQQNRKQYQKMPLKHVNQCWRLEVCTLVHQSSPDSMRVRCSRLKTFLAF